MNFGLHRGEGIFYVSLFSTGKKPGTALAICDFALGVNVVTTQPNETISACKYAHRLLCAATSGYLQNNAIICSYHHQAEELGACEGKQLHDVNQS